MKNLLKRYNLRELKADIHKFGFTYTTRDFMVQALMIIALILTVAWFSRLQLRYITILVIFGLALAPFWIMAWFTQAYNIKRFTMVQDYLDNIIPVFMQKTKIRYTLGELHELTSGEMRDVIFEAISYIDNTTNDVNLLRNALKIIENRFRNSRIRSVHKLLLSIESTSSSNYEDVCSLMHRDIESWIKRVYVFQKDLKDRRNKLLILCSLTLMMNCLFVYVYVGNEFFNGFTDLTLYQISTLTFIIAILSVITVLLLKLGGGWLADDLKRDDEERLKRKYLLYKNCSDKVDLVYVLIALIFLVITVYMFFRHQVRSGLVTLIFALFCLFEKKRQKSQAYNLVTRSFTIEFPIWLREISLNLNRLTVLNAIDNSLNTVSFPMRCELKSFLREAREDPTSIAPYNKFLQEYDLQDGRSSMKVLYGIQNLGKNDLKVRVNSLVERNEEMLSKAEVLRNDDAISGIEFIGYLPTIIFTIQMIVSMFVMFGFMMTSIGKVGL